MDITNQNIINVLEITKKIYYLTDKGNIEKENQGCGILYSFIREYANKIHITAINEIN